MYLSLESEKELKENDYQSEKVWHINNTGIREGIERCIGIRPQPLRHVSGQLESEKELKDERRRHYPLLRALWNPRRN